MNTLSDAQMIDNLMTETPFEAIKFNTADWGYVPDINGLSYQDRAIFSTTTLKSKLIDYNSAFLTIPMTLTRVGCPLANAGSATTTSNGETVPSYTTADFTVNNNVNATYHQPGTQCNYLKPPTGTDTLLAWRDSILNMFVGLIVSTDNGLNIVNETSRIDFINNLRLKIENSTDWEQSIGSMLQFALDTVPTFTTTLINDSGATPHYVNARNNNTNAQTFVTNPNLTPANYGTPAQGAAIASAVTGLMAVNDPTYNAGLARRIQFFQNQSVFVPGVATTNFASYQLVAKIPIRLLHDFFEQLDFPIINVGFNFQFIFRQSQNPISANNQVSQQPTYYANIPPLMGGQLVSITGATPTVAGQVAIQYGSAPLVKSGGGTISGCRMYYRSIKLNPAENAEFAAHLTKGFTKRVKFISTDNYFPSQPIPPTGTTSLQISSAIVWPLRVWALLYGNGNVSTNGPQTGALSGDFISTSATVNQAAVNGLQVVHGWMQNANIQINNQNYFVNPLQTVDDFWCQIRDQFNKNTQSMIDYDKFLRLFRYHCFDISRLSDRLPSKTETVSLTLTFDRADEIGGYCDLVVMIERLNQVQFDFAASDVHISVGNITTSNAPAAA